MVRLAGQLSRFHSFKALVVGDFMLDAYTSGMVSRISPEAPVSVLKVNHQTFLPGGAGNVVLNLLDLGAEVHCLGRVGKDRAGWQLKEKLFSRGADALSIFVEQGYQTPIKNRFLAEGQQILRVDTEDIRLLSAHLEKKVIEKLPQILKSIQVVAISDYNKGFLSETLLQAMIILAKKNNIPVIVDPKGDHFPKYQGATLIKPNLKEAYEAAKIPLKESLDLVADILLKQTDADMLLITRSEEGMALFQKTATRKDFPVQAKEVVDVTGAGDTVLAMICASFANQIDINYAASFANIAAGIVLEKLGCVSVSLSDLARRLLEFDSENKIFDESHVYALKKVLEKRDFSVLAMNSKEKFSLDLFRQIRKLAAKDHHEVILYVLDTDPDQEFISFLASLNEVHFIVLQSKGFRDLCENLQPKNMLILQEGKIKPLRKEQLSYVL